MTAVAILFVSVAAACVLAQNGVEVSGGVVVSLLVSLLVSFVIYTYEREGEEKRRTESEVLLRNIAQAIREISNK